MVRAGVFDKMLSRKPYSLDLQGLGLKIWDVGFGCLRLWARWLEVAWVHKKGLGLGAERLWALGHQGVWPRGSSG